MKKKLEAELISIAHRILKLKNRAELDQLQQETLKLYEKISVLRFVEDNFSDVKPTISYASAEETLEEIYGIEETPVVHANEQEAKADEVREEHKNKRKEATEPAQDKENDKGEGVTAGSDADEVVSEEEKEATDESSEAAEEPHAESNEEVVEQKGEGETPEEGPEENIDTKPEGDADPGQPVEEYQASEEEKEITQEKEEDEPQADSQQVKAESQDSTPKTHNPESSTGFSFDFEKKEEQPKQKEITFEDYRDYKEPEFVKKGEEPKATSQQAEEENAPEPANVQKEWLPKEPEVIQQQEENIRDWRDWEPAKDEPKEEEKPKATSQQAQPETCSSQPSASSSTRSINLGLNDRIAFEKNLFGGSGEDLNRVLSQLNTFDTYEHAVEFINDMVKPDYNNWQGKEEYEERFMALVEQKFS